MLVRGVITTSSLSFDEVMENPLIEVPDDLRMTELVASQKLNPLLNALGLPSIQRLSGDMQVAMLLASEKSKGQHKASSTSFPYDSDSVHPHSQVLEFVQVLRRMFLAVCCSLKAAYVGFTEVRYSVNLCGWDEH